MEVLMLLCPATYCNVNGSVYSPASVRNVCRSALAQLRHLLFEHPGPERLRRILRAREHVLAVGLLHELLEHCLHLAIDDQLPFARPPLQTALDGELARILPVALMGRTEAHTALPQLQHLVPADAGVARKNRGRAQGLGFNRRSQ